MAADDDTVRSYHDAVDEPEPLDRLHDLRDLGLGVPACRCSIGQQGWPTGFATSAKKGTITAHKLRGDTMSRSVVCYCFCSSVRLLFQRGKGRLPA